jgi:hypothetical protein
MMFSFISIGLSAQVYTATAKLDTNIIRLGEQSKLTLMVRFPSEILKDESHFIQWPLQGDTISKNIEILERGTIDTTLSSDKKTFLLTQSYNITSFDSGFWVIPPFRFLKSGDKDKFFETQALLLEVRSLEIDTTEAIKDIKPPFEVPFTFAEALPYIIAALLVAILVALLVYFIRKRRKKTSETVQEIKIILPPHIIAMDKLNELKKQKLWQNGQIKEYHILLTEIVRVYLQDRFGLRALEQTSDEILLQCRNVTINDSAKGKLQQLLKLADLVKFAKINPIGNENEMSIENAMAFINETKPEEQVEKEKEEVVNA